MWKTGAENVDESFGYEWRWRFDGCGDAHVRVMSCLRERES